MLFFLLSMCEKSHAQKFFLLLPLRQPCRVNVFSRHRGQRHHSSGDRDDNASPFYEVDDDDDVKMEGECESEVRL